MVQASYNDLVDISNKTASFNSAAFEEILRFSQEYGCLPEQAELTVEAMTTYHLQEQEQDKIRNGSLFLGIADGRIGTSIGWRFLWNGSGSDVTLSGIPAQDTNRVLCQPGQMIAISEGGKKDPAWEFVKILLSQEAQQKLEEKFPVHQGQLQRLLDEQKKPPEEDSKADLLVYQLLSDDAIQTLYEIQDRAAALSLTDAKIMEIIIPESQAYFAGQKTLEATIEIIQNRTTTYVNQL